MNIVGKINWYVGDDYAYLKFSESKNAFSIDIVIVPAPHRNQRIGTMLIKRILLLADTMGKQVCLTARPLGTCNDENIQRLVSYYKRFDFYIEGRGLTTAFMVREPQKIS